MILRPYGGACNIYNGIGWPGLKKMGVEISEVLNLTFIPDDIAFDYLKYRLETGDTIIQTVGSWPNNPKSVVGKVIKVPPEVSGALLNQNAVKIIPNKTLDRKYIFYLLKSDSFKDFIINCAQGAASQASITLTDIKNYPFLLPPLPTQQKIAAIISAYDDLIENNTRRIKILEEMAQALYREWFVKFRFPGHEKVKMVESELGIVPEGWEVKCLSDVCNIVMGQSPKSEFYNDIGEGLPFHQGVTDFGDRFPTDRKYCTVMNRIAEAGDILFSVRAPVGRINISDKKIVIGRGLCAIRSNSSKQTYVLQQLKEQFMEEDTIGGGTIFKSVTKADVHGIKLLVPTEVVLNRFEEIMIPIFAELKNLTFKNVNLRHTRDLLLPKLISGEINVRNLEIEMGEKYT